MGIFRRSTWVVLLIAVILATAVMAFWPVRPLPDPWRFLWSFSAVMVVASCLVSFLLVIRAMRLQVAGKSNELREKERFLVTLMGNLPGMAYRRADDRDGSLEIVSEGGFALTGYHSIDMVRFRDLVHPDDMGIVFPKEGEETAAGRSFRRQYRLRTKAGDEKWVLEQGIGVPGADGRGMFVEGFLLDITHYIAGRKEAEQLRIERDAVKAASKTKSDFLASIGHEIRTPLNSILGFSQILQAQLREERLQQYIHAISASGKTLLRLINDLLDLSKIEAGKFELQPSAVDLRRVAREIQLVFMPSVDEKQLEFVVELDPNLPSTVFLDEVRLRQILVNLLRNAFKFTDKGRISLSVRVVGTSRAGTVDLEFAVADTGIGVPPEDRETIFEAFIQQKRLDHAKYTGTGLGLSITKRLVEILGGRISLHSEIGKGSTFTAVLRGIQIADDNFNRSLQGNDGRNIRFDEEAVVLVIDSMDSDRLLIREFLRSTKLAVVETISIANGVDWCMAIKPDLILLDYAMSLHSGPTLVQRFNRVKEELNIPIVVMTSVTGVGSDDFYTDYRFDGWLGKPLLFEDVMRMLARFLPHATLGREDDALGVDRREEYALPDSAEVRQAVAGLHDRLPVVQRILGNLLEQWQDIQETCIINEMKTFAEEIERLAKEYNLDFLAVWARILLRRIRLFDMERVPETFQLFAGLIDLIEECSRPVEAENKKSDSAPEEIPYPQI